MKKIYKYIIHEGECIPISLPENSVFLRVDQQNQQIVLWFIIDEINNLHTRSFSTFQTGKQLPFDILDQKFLGSVQLYNGSYVSHVFEIIK